MQVTDNVVARLKPYTAVSYQPNMIFTVAEDATEAEIAETLERVGEYGLVVSLDEIAANTENEINTQLREELPVPLFLLFASTVAFFSVTVLFVYRKRHDMSIIYLCGGSEKDCVVLSLTACAVISVIPALICAVFILNVNWLTQLLHLNLAAYYINWTTYTAVLFYEISVIAIAAVVVRAMMARHTPLTFLRGTNE